MTYLQYTDFFDHNSSFPHFLFLNQELENYLMSKFPVFFSVSSCCLAIPQKSYDSLHEIISFEIYDHPFNTYTKFSNISYPISHEHVRIREYEMLFLCYNFAYALNFNGYLHIWDALHDLVPSAQFKKHATLLSVTLLHGCFSRFFKLHKY